MPLRTNIMPFEALKKIIIRYRFSAGNTEENMDKYIEKEFSTENQIDELNDANSEIYFA
jgi:hypothetical protein